MLCWSSGCHPLVPLRSVRARHKFGDEQDGVTVVLRNERREAVVARGGTGMLVGRHEGRAGGCRHELQLPATPPGTCARLARTASASEPGVPCFFRPHRPRRSGIYTYHQGASDSASTPFDYLAVHETYRPGDNLHTSSRLTRTNPWRYCSDLYAPAHSSAPTRPSLPHCFLAPHRAAAAAFGHTKN